jgi:hypothetical protein
MFSSRTGEGRMAGEKHQEVVGARKSRLIPQWPIPPYGAQKPSMVRILRYLGLVNGIFRDPKLTLLSESRRACYSPEDLGVYLLEGGMLCIDG